MRCSECLWLQEGEWVFPPSVALRYKLVPHHQTRYYSYFYFHFKQAGAVHLLGSRELHHWFSTVCLCDHNLHLKDGCSFWASKRWSQPRSASNLHSFQSPAGGDSSGCIEVCDSVTGLSYILGQGVLSPQCSLQGSKNQSYYRKLDFWQFPDKKWAHIQHWFWSFQWIFLQKKNYKRAREN